jgi:hypothetical protein
MKPEVGRRVFVGTVVAGLPLLTGKATVLAQGVAGGHDHAPLAANDPVLEQIVRQIAAIHNSAQAGLRGEHTRALAMQLRMLAVYERQLGVDDHVRAAAREMVDREGRGAILYAEPDVEGRRRAMRQYGFRPDDRGPDLTPPPTHAQREAALDRLLAEGITPAFDRLATAAELVGRELDRRSVKAINIALQDDADYIRGYCESIWDSYQDAQLMAIPFCLAAKYFEWMTPSCLALEGGAAILLLAWIIKCLNVRMP